MKNIIYFYIGISLILLLKNLIHLIHCNYIRTKFAINHKNKTPLKNYELKNSIIYLIKTAKVDNDYVIKADILVNSYYSPKIDNYLLQAQSEYIYLCKHTLLWGCELLKKCRLFSPVFKHTKNIFATIIICFLEMFAAYLLGLYFDTTGIGNKILSALTSLVTSLINSIR